MNIKVIRENLIALSDQEAVGEYGKCDLEIHIHEGLPLVTQRSLVIHSVIEHFCQNWSHDKVVELGELITDALVKLEGD